MLGNEALKEDRNECSHRCGCQALGSELNCGGNGKVWRFWNREYAKSFVWQWSSSSSMGTKGREPNGDQPVDVQDIVAITRTRGPIILVNSSVPSKQRWLVILTCCCRPTYPEKWRSDFQETLKYPPNCTLPSTTTGPSSYQWSWFSLILDPFTSRH